MYKSITQLKCIFSKKAKGMDIVDEQYNQDYEALTFSLNGKTYKSRLAKKHQLKQVIL